MILSAVGYGQYALNVAAGGGAGVNQQCDASQFDVTQPPAANFTVHHADPTTKTITFWHPSIIGSHTGSLVASGTHEPGLSRAAAVHLMNHVNTRAGYQVISHPDDWTDWVMVAVGIGLIATGVILAAVLPGSGIPLILVGLAVTSLVIGGVIVAYIGASAWYNEPTITDGGTNPNGATCKYVTAKNGSCKLICSDGTSTDCSTSPFGDISKLLTTVAVVAVVGVGGYIALKAAQSHYAGKGASAGASEGARKIYYTGRRYAGGLARRTRAAGSAFLSSKPKANPHRRIMVRQ